MNKMKNVDTIKNTINRSIVSMFLILIISAVFVIYFTSDDFKQNLFINQQEIEFSRDLYKSRLSEKLSIIATSFIFIDYLRSGIDTRAKIEPAFLTRITSIIPSSVVGMKIFDKNSNEIFNYGTISSTQISLKLCYLNQMLDPAIGDCDFEWQLYFRVDYLLQDLQKINPHIKQCKDCPQYDLMAGKQLGSFPVISASGYMVPLSIENSRDYFFYLYFLLMTVALVIFGVWSWHRVSSLLRVYIAQPIKNVSAGLKSDNLILDENNIEEIQYLISEINNWKNRLEKIKSDEHAVRLGEIAAQLAHDIRSPLAVIDMLSKQLTEIPANYKKLLQNASQRIADIANSFLNQYRMPAELSHDELTPQHLASLLKQMIDEKISQYSNREINIDLNIEKNAEHVNVNVNANHFKRIISNLINNAVEAIDTKGQVNLACECNDFFTRITLSDSGRGIPQNILPKIKAGGTSLGKKHGSGLGLSHAIKNIKAWNGQFDIQSEIGKGTQVIIILPSVF